MEDCNTDGSKIMLPVQDALTDGSPITEPMFRAESKITLECKKCKKVEIITLGDLPHSPKGSFVLPFNYQCATCLGVVSGVIFEGDE